MSVLTSERSESPDFLPCLRLDPDGPPPALHFLCNRIVGWVASFGTMTNRITWAEANDMSECDVDAASEQEEQVLLEMIYLAVTIAELRATNQVEIVGKQAALNALSSIPAWERDSLDALRCSVERDQQEVNAALVAKPQLPALSMRWLSRFNFRLARA